MAFNNLGLVDVQSGLLSFNSSSGLIGGTYNTGPFASINYYYGTLYDSQPRSQFSPAMA